MLFLRKLVFKLLELSLGLRPAFNLATKDPAFVNFRLDAAEADAVRGVLPPGFTLCALRFAASDDEPAFWVSYNLYELRHPKKEMAHIRKVRCEINTFVRDPSGRQGVFVFAGSPLVSAEEARDPIARVADMAERLVMFLYGCGRLVRLRYALGTADLRISFDEVGSKVDLEVPVPDVESERLSDDYHRFNDVSFFAEGRTFDLVSVDSSYVLARFARVDAAAVEAVRVTSPFFQRAPDAIYVHRGDVSYFVNALHAAARA
jgi:hypothetical protein